MRWRRNVWKPQKKDEIFTHFFEKTLAFENTLWYYISAFRMTADSLFVPFFEEEVSKGEETVRGNN